MEGAGEEVREGVGGALLVATPGPHTPKAGKHPAPQYSVEAPQNPQELQHCPVGHNAPWAWGPHTPVASGGNGAGSQGAPWHGSEVGVGEGDPAPPGMAQAP